MWPHSSAPLFKTLVDGARQLIKERGPKWGAPRFSAFLAQADQKLEHAGKQLAQLEATWELFLPFVAGERVSAADITALVTIDFAKALDISIPEGHRALTRWKDVVSSRSSMSA